MAAKEWEKLLDPKKNKVWTKTSILRGLNLVSPLSSSVSGFGNSFNNPIISSGAHLALILAIIWFATLEPGRCPN